MRPLKRALGFFLGLILITGCQKEEVFFNSVPIVNAGSDTTITLSSSTGDSIRLSGSATDKEGSVLKYLWSQESGPNTPVIATNGSVSTSIKGVIAGTYVFQLMATDKDGATGVATVRATIVAAPVLTSTLQPNQNPFEVLLVVNGGGDASDETAPEIAASAWTSGGSPAFTRGIFKFDFSKVSSSAKVISAKLTLYSNPTPLNGNQVDANFGSDNSMLIQRVTSNWTSTVTWQNQPVSTTLSQILIPHTTVSKLDLVDIDVTDLVKEMVKTTNNGFLIKLQNETAFNSRNFCSSKYTDASRRPKLVLQYSE